MTSGDPGRTEWRRCVRLKVMPPGAMNQINGAYDRMLKSDVKYWFVIDIGTLK